MECKKDTLSVPTVTLQRSFARIGTPIPNEPNQASAPSFFLIPGLSSFAWRVKVELRLVEQELSEAPKRKRWRS
jgi:hypothetical protein